MRAVAAVGEKQDRRRSAGGGSCGGTQKEGASRMRKRNQGKMRSLIRTPQKKK